MLYVQPVTKDAAINLGWETVAKAELPWAGSSLRKQGWQWTSFIIIYFFYLTIVQCGKGQSH